MAKQTIRLALINVCFRGHRGHRSAEPACLLMTLADIEAIT